MTYIIEITKTCDDSLPMLFSGNAFSPGTFKFTCQCGKEANVHSSQEVGLDPSDPEFQGRVEALLVDSAILTYYVVTVSDGKLTMEPRFRTQGSVEYHTVLECRTCNKTVGGPKCTQSEMDEFVEQHKSHDFHASTVVNSPDARVLKLVEEIIKNKKGYPLPVAKEQ